MYLSPMKGLFVYSPFLLLTFAGLFKRHRKISYTSLLSISYIVIISIIYSLWKDCFGATTLGNRYLVSTLPFWGILLFQNYQAFWTNKILKFVFIILSFISIVNILLNTYTGIAGSKFGKCENINTYNPYLRIKENYIDKKPKTAPIIIKVFFNNK